MSTDKRYQTADWRERPLSTEMLHYARLDTHYLLSIYDSMVCSFVWNWFHFIVETAYGRWTSWLRLIDSIQLCVQVSISPPKYTNRCLFICFLDLIWFDFVLRCIQSLNFVRVALPMSWFRMTCWFDVFVIVVLIWEFVGNNIYSYRNRVALHCRCCKQENKTTTEIIIISN